MANAHHVINHINAVGPQEESVLIAWVVSQLVDTIEKAKRVIASDLRVYAYIEDGRTYYTTKSQDPR